MNTTMKFLVTTMVAGAVIGVLAPLSSEANNAQIKTTHVAKPYLSKSKPSFHVAVHAAPNTPAVAPSKPSGPKYIHR